MRCSPPAALLALGRDVTGRHNGIGIVGFLGFPSRSDAELEAEREALRLQYVDCQDIDEASRLYDELHDYDVEMTNRANETYSRDNPDAAPRHREHGWSIRAW